MQLYINNLFLIFFMLQHNTNLNYLNVKRSLMDVRMYIKNLLIIESDDDVRSFIFEVVKHGAWSIFFRCCQNIRMLKMFSIFT